jgi:putative NADH-flavin reductase
MKTEQTRTPLKLLVAGATGGIGRQVVEQALNAGHLVTALVRNAANLSIEHSSLSIVEGDVTRLETFKEHLMGHDVVISAIGVRGGVLDDKPTTLYSVGNANILQAMREAKITRAVFISASAVEISPALPLFVRLAAKYIMQKLLKHMYADLLRMEKIVKQSKTDWTIIRPPRLTDKPLTGHYRFLANAFLKNALSISRADVAHFILHQVHNEETYHATVEIAY